MELLLCASCLSMVPWHLRPRAGLWVGTTPSQQMDDECELIALHEVGIKSGLLIRNCNWAFQSGVQEVVVREGVGCWPSVNLRVVKAWLKGRMWKFWILRLSLKTEHSLRLKLNIPNQITSSLNIMIFLNWILTLVRWMCKLGLKLFFWSHLKKQPYMHLSIMTVYSIYPIITLAVNELLEHIHDAFKASCFNYI